MDEVTAAKKIIDKAEETLNDAKSKAYNAIVNYVRALCHKYDVDHICLENVHFQPVFYEDTEETVWGIASIRIDPEMEDCLQLTRFYEEDWEKAMNREGYIWIDFFDINPDYSGIMSALNDWDCLKRMESEE